MEGINQFSIFQILSFLSVICFYQKACTKYVLLSEIVFSLFQQEGTIDSDTVTHQDYAAVKGERYPTKKPEDSDVLHGDGSFISKTTKNTEYTAKKGERYEAIKHEESDIWKVNANK